jgi:NAD(P)-dependent dehydrogenase (short-subunit alcohol dehydrogenase family)
MDFKGKVVWITGGGSGLGAAMAHEFARLGADVAVSGRRAGRLDEVVAALSNGGHPGRFLGVPCDVTDDDAVREAAASVVSALGRLDVVVANAGFSVSGRMETLTADDWRRQFDVNVVGTASTVYHSLPHLQKTKGRLALVGSVAGTIATPGAGAYSASKYAVRAMGQTLSIELHGSGVSCTTIQPGFVKSDIGMTDNDGVFHEKSKDRRPSKLLWETADAARVMVRAIYKRKREYTFTGHGRLGAFLGMHAPGFVFFVLSRSKSRIPLVAD